MGDISVGDVSVRQRTVRVNGVRLLQTLEELARIGADAQGGVSREAFTPADDEARDYLAGKAAEAGLYSYVDEAGNLVIRMAEQPSGRPVLLMGSHLDSVTNGGRLDGAYGVVAALEVLRVFAEQGIDTRYEPVVVAFTNEEGALFPWPFWGSLALTGQLVDPETAVDREGRSIREPLARAGGDLDRIADAAWPEGVVAAYLELHIEQGPVLEDRAFPIGVVDAIVGRTIFEFAIRGQQNHAGTTPMTHRADALVAAAQVVLAVESVSKERDLCAVSTVGILDVEPGLTNVVPGRASLSVEIRDTRQEQLARAERAVYAATEEIGRRVGVDIDVEVTMRSQPVHTDGRLVAAISAAAEELDLPYLTLSSGAGHDAQIVGAVAPVGMVFVPSKGGVSHAPEEDTDDVHLVAGADVLASAAANL